MKPETAQVVRDTLDRQVAAELDQLQALAGRLQHLTALLEALAAEQQSEGHEPPHGRVFQP